MTKEKQNDIKVSEKNVSIKDSPKDKRETLVKENRMGKPTKGRESQRRKEERKKQTNK